jgi:signal peptidase I
VTNASPAVRTVPASARVACEPASPSSLNSAATIAEQIRTNGSVCLRVYGMSMFPWIRPGDLVFVRRCEFSTVRPGDVVLYERDERYFVHRVLEKAHAGNALISKGDSLDGTDGPVLAEQFLGRAIRLHRRQRHIDLQSLAHVVLGRVLARLSPASPLLYRPLRMGRRLLAVAKAI